MNMNNQKMSQRIGVFEPKALSLSPVLVERNVAEKKKKKKKVCKSYKTKSSGASPSKNFEPNSLSLIPEFCDENIAEKKKKKKWVSEAQKDHISEERLFPQHIQKSLSVEIQSSDKCSKISGQGSADSGSDWLLEDDVVSCSKRVELEDTTNHSHTGFGNDAKENRQFGWNRRQYNDREGHVNWGKKPSYRIRVTDVNQAENRSWAERKSLANDNNLATPLNTYGQNNAREEHVSWRKKPTSHRIGVKNVNQAENRSWAERNSLANEGILPTPLISSGPNNAANGYRRDRNMPPRQRDASPQKLNGILYVSAQSQVGGLEDDSEELAGRSTNILKPVKINMREGPPNFGVNFSTASSLEHLNCNMREGPGAHDANVAEACLLKPVNCNMPRNYEANFSLGHGKCVSFHKKNSLGRFGTHYYKNRDTSSGTNGQQISSYDHQHYFNSPAMSSKEVLNGVQPHESKKISNTEYEFGNSLDVPLESIMCCHSDHKLNKHIGGANIQKSAAVSPKEFKPVSGNSSGSISNSLDFYLPNSNWELNKSHLGENTITCHQPMSHDDPKVQSAAKKGEKIESRGYDAKCRGPKDTGLLFLVGSQIGMKALRFAYQMQLASETVQLAMGCPLAEFEKFVQCAAPVVRSSYVHKECSIRLDTQLSFTLQCKHQIPNVSLHNVWKWYEIPGNYGLDVKVSTPKTLTGAPNDSDIFQAYYVPYLSAIQLFGPHIPGSKRSSSLKSLKEAFHNHIQFGSVDASLSDGSDPCSPVFSTNAELIFEFFDVELPHHRRPFYNKILELIDAGTSNPHVFGDASKLASMNLRDLHPASWFSVAWYPIYQIPEGHLCASFLTYHSLGHFVQRSGSGDSQNGRLGDILFPTLGLQSYNSQDECWFEPKIPSSEEPTSFDTAGILIKRLRSLDENALRFSRGWVHKDKNIVQNRHPDYEFFVSRKAHFARRATPFIPVT